MTRNPERRLAWFVDEVLRDRRPRRFRATPEELAAMRAAARLRAARPGADLPRPEFIDRLGGRLRRELVGDSRRAALSRRRLLLGASGAAVAAVAGAAAGVVGDHLAQGGGGGSRWLVPEGATWQPVMAAASVLDGEAVRFSTGVVEGVVVNHDGRYQAMSAVCTHLGCRLQPGAGRLDCPCHRTAFSMDGQVLFHELPRQPASLPLLHTRVRDGQVEVLTA